MHTSPCTTIRRSSWLLAALSAAALTACGGSADGDASNAQANGAAGTQASALVATGTTTLQLEVDALPAAAAAQLAQPTFHVAPVLLNEPADTDAVDANASAHTGPRTQAVPAEFARLSTRGLTVQTLDAARRMRALGIAAPSADGTVAPLATASAISTYTPAQIRAAYGLPTLPAAGASLSAAQAAQLGAGQTIYIVDAMHNPNVAAELAAFNLKFGLPTCSTKAIATGASLPLAAPPAAACELSIVYNTTTGTMTSAAPAYDAGWATEISLDVQWAHATAPLARVVLIEAASASLDALLGAVKLANAMGPGAVSMSFGATEGNYTASVDPAFAGTGMSYLAATGDYGAQVSWPAVSPKVLAVGGTTLNYSGSGARSEVAWAKTGGGVSAYTAAPSYQTSAVPGMGTPVRRTVADVAFNADPNTGQYVAIITPGAAAATWISAGGTSLSTPQWAGLVAVTNAMRAQAGKSAIGAAHATLYGPIASVPGTYASTFADITAGNHGTCTTCSAKVGFDQLTGLGTPNVTNLLNGLSGAAVAATAPVVTPAAISGKVGTALSFTVSVNAPNPVTYTLTGAPSGMTVAASGAVTWATPVAGTYPVTVTVKDSKTGLTGQGVITVTIVPLSAPVVSAASVSGKAGTALSFGVAVTSPNPVTCSMTGAPAGMAISSTGVLTWANPVLGTYAITVTAKDGKTGLSGQGLISVTIAAAATAGPIITAPAMQGVVGKALIGTIGISAPGATSLSVSISGAPMGMTFSMSGLSITATWASPVLGSYSLKVVVTDSAGRSTQATVPVTIAAK